MAGRGERVGRTKIERREERDKNQIEREREGERTEE